MGVGVDQRKQQPELFLICFDFFFGWVFYFQFCNTFVVSTISNINQLLPLLLLPIQVKWWKKTNKNLLVLAFPQTHHPKVGSSSMTTYAPSVKTRKGILINCSRRSRWINHFVDVARARHKWAVTLRWVSEGNEPGTVLSLLIFNSITVTSVIGVAEMSPYACGCCLGRLVHLQLG